MTDDDRDDLLRRLTALVVKIDERDDRLVAMLEKYDAMLEEQRDFNRQQLQINAQLTALMRAALPQRPNGQEE